ncbi:MAG: hypothetical protein U5L96_08030 [Owenweeksia sp.]|nr:hypothetical protein [Owenweeksia sp.]
MIWGNDGGSIGDWTTTGAPAGKAILSRIWKYQETGSIGNFEIQLPDNSSGAATKLPPEQNNVYLFVDNDPAFTAGGAQHTMSQSGSNWEYSHTTDSYAPFTFATDAIDASLSVTQNGNETGPVDITYTVTLSATNNTGSAITFDLSDLSTGLGHQWQ